MSIIRIIVIKRAKSSCKCLCKMLVSVKTFLQTKDDDVIFTALFCQSEGIITFGTVYETIILNSLIVLDFAVGDKRRKIYIWCAWKMCWAPVFSRNGFYFRLEKLSLRRRPSLFGYEAKDRFILASF